VALGICEAVADEVKVELGNDVLVIGRVLVKDRIVFVT
jgi:hypothetical protein